MTTSINEQETKMHNIVEHAKKILDSYSEIRHWEIFGGINSSQEYQIEKSFLKQSDLRKSNVITIRVFGENGKTGSVSITKLSKDFLQIGIKNAVNTMKSSIKNKEFRSIAKPSEKYPKIETPWDPKISKLTADDSLELIDRFLEQKKRDDRIKSITGGLSYSDSRIRILNSNGIDRSEKGTDSQSVIEFIMQDTINGKKEDGRGYDYQGYNSFSELKNDLERVFDTGYEFAVKNLKKIKLETGNYPVILSPYTVSLLIAGPIKAGLNAEDVHQKRSFLQDSIGKKIASDSLTIIDDPLLKNGLETSSFDGEGVATRKKFIMENGVLKSLLHNVYTANLFNTESTGNASRSWSSPSIGIDTFNIIVETGDSPLDQLIEDISYGIYLENSYDRPNIVTGEFSGLITNGFLIKNGQLGSSLRETMLGTNLLALYKKIQAISKERVRKMGQYLPYMLIDELKISGSK